MSLRRRPTTSDAEGLVPEGFVRTKFGLIPKEEVAARAAAVQRRRAHHEANRTDPDYWVRKAEAALSWGVDPAKVSGYLALARYYRDGTPLPGMEKKA